MEGNSPRSQGLHSSCSEKGSLRSSQGWRRQGPKTPPGSRVRRQDAQEGEWERTSVAKGKPLSARERGLTAWVLVGLHAVDDAQQSAREPQQLAEAVEAKVDEVVRQADHLRRGGGTEASVSPKQ